MEYELIIGLIPAVAPFKLSICAMAIGLAQCIMCPGLQFPSLEVLHKFCCVAVPWPPSAALSPTGEVFPSLSWVRDAPSLGHPGQRPPCTDLNALQAFLALPSQAWFCLVIAILMYLGFNQVTHLLGPSIFPPVNRALPDPAPGRRLRSISQRGGDGGKATSARDGRCYRWLIGSVGPDSCSETQVHRLLTLPDKHM